MCRSLNSNCTVDQSKLMPCLASTATHNPRTASVSLCRFPSASAGSAWQSASKVTRVYLFLGLFLLTLSSAPGEDDRRPTKRQKTSPLEDGGGETIPAWIQEGIARDAAFQKPQTIQQEDKQVAEFTRARLEWLNGDSSRLFRKDINAIRLRGACYYPFLYILR